MDRSKDHDDNHDSNSQSESNGIKDDDIEAPDGGWGWLVVFGAFSINLITDGCAYSFGVLFTNLVDYFGSSRSDTAWIGSLFNAAPLLCGPVASVITNKVGFRKATIIGGLITSVGFIFSSFANSIDALCVTYGIVAGLGVSLPYLVSTVVVATYFKRKRALATGISECGAGVGTLIFAPLLQYLIMSYGWRGALLILAGIVSNIIICGAIFRPIDQRGKTTQKRNSERDNSLPLLIQNGNHIADDSIKCDLSFQDDDNLKDCSDLENNTSDPYNTRKRSSTTNSLYRNSTMLEVQSSSVLGGSLTSIPKLVRVAKNYPEASSRIKVSKRVNCCHKLNKSFIDVSVLTKWKFIIFSASNFFLYFWYDVPYVFTVDRATELGETEERASYLVAVIGVSHTVANIIYGYLGDRKWINRSYLYCVSMLFCGFSLVIVPLFTTFIPSAILVAFFGIFSAAAEALVPVIICDILGLSKLTDAFGILMFLQGTANLIGPPVAGLLFDISGTYNNTFFAAGSCVMITGMLFLVVPVLKNLKEFMSRRASQNC